jgi:integrase
LRTKNPFAQKQPRTQRFSGKRAVRLPGLVSSCQSQTIGHFPVLLWRPSGEAKQIEWRQVDFRGALIRLEEDQTKNSEARTVPLPDVLVRMLKRIEPGEGTVFDVTNLRKAWCKACVAAGLGTLTEVEGKPDPRYTGLIIHDLRHSAIKNLMNVGVNEKVAMEISGHKTRAVFDRYHIVDTQDVVDAMRRLQNGEKIVEIALPGRRRKLLKA